MNGFTHTSPLQDRGHEVVVVGARCAGAATAMLLARQGHDVLLVDRAAFPSDTLSTHAIARGGIVQLQRWGLLDAVVASGAPKIRTLTFHLGSAGSLTKRVKERAGVDHLLAPRRYSLDTILLSAAIDAGASFRSGISVVGTITDGTGRVVGVRARDADGVVRDIRAGLVVGADGVRSGIARSVGAPVIDARRSESAAHYAYARGLDADGFEFHLGDGALAGVFPTNDGEANVWVCMPAARAGLDVGDRESAFLALLEQTSPSLGKRMRRAALTSTVRSAVKFPNHVRQAWGPGWALVGDAGYHRDPITGHGITDAFRDAELLAHQIHLALRGEVPEAAAMAAYAEARDRALAPIFDVTCRLAGFPPPAQFSDLQKHLSALIEAEAAWLAALPYRPADDRLVAA